MRNRFYLKELTVDDGEDVFTMLKEIGADENGFKNPVHEMDEEGFKKYLKDNADMAKGILQDQKLVPQTTYWLYKNDYPVGIIRLCHCLNDDLKVNGGHTGFCIRPDQRNKGFGKIILKLLMEKAREKGINELLITTNHENIYSRKVIRHNRGIMDKTVESICYYIVKTGASTVNEEYIDEEPESPETAQNAAGNTENAVNTENNENTENNGNMENNENHEDMQ